MACVARAQVTGPIGSFARLGLATASSPCLVVMYCFDLRPALVCDVTGYVVYSNCDTVPPALL
jgi:hypothetical protein